MRVCVDIQSAIAQRAGVGRYTRCLVEHLGPLARAEGVDLRLAYFDFRRRALPFPSPGATRRAIRLCPGRFVQAAWKRMHAPPYNWLAGRADLYHFPNFIRPPLTRGRSIVTVHDVSFLRLPETTETRNLAYLNARIRETVRRADAILTISRFSAREIEELLHVSPDRIHPIHLGLDPSFRRPAEASIPPALQSLGLQAPYLLTVSTLEPRKNIPFLVDVFERLPDFDGDLVIAGGRGWKDAPILERMRTSPLASRIRYLEYVPDGALPALYAGAAAFLFPSLYEGFGFPPLEAMACGTPVLAAPTASLPEVLGEAALFPDPRDPDAWVHALQRVLTATDVAADRVRRGEAQAARYRWEHTARDTWNVYRTLLPTPSP